MPNLKENLLAGDLSYLVKDVFEIDSFSSKMGEDEDIVVLSFTVDQMLPAKDLVQFIESGYDFVLDADTSPGELNDGKYKVFVEIERTKNVPSQIMEVLDGIKKLANIDSFKFRYYKSFKSTPATIDSLSSIIPKTSEEYNTSIKENRLNNFSNFFNKSYVESIDVDDDTITFQKKYAEPLRLRILGFDNKSKIYESTEGRIMLESKDIAQVLFLTKYIGNYNITKVGNCFIFENEGYAVALENI